MQLTGIHHLTAITADARRNHDFYTRTIGMRLVKKTVNQDDTSAYPLFYGDGRPLPAATSRSLTGRPRRSGGVRAAFPHGVARYRRGNAGWVDKALRQEGCEAPWDLSATAG